MGVIEDIQNFLAKYIVFQNEAHPTILSFWILNTWFWDKANFCPYIYLFSAEKQSGKTLTMEVMETLTRNPLRAVDATSAALFRAIDSMSPTIFLDEVDTIFTGSAGKQELCGLLNSGYKRGGAIIRVDREAEHGIRTFTTYGPKVLAGIDNSALPDTIASRCIPVQLSRKPDNVEVEDFYLDDAQEAAEPILEAIDAMLEDEGFCAEYAKIRPEKLKGVEPRQNEIARPLLSLSEILDKRYGTSYTKALTDAMMVVFARPETNVGTSVLEVILQTVYDAFESMRMAGDRYADKIFTEDILTALSENGNMGITGKMLSNHLDKIGVNPKTIRRGSTVLKGYTRDQFEDAWKKFITIDLTDVVA
jgi:hypothetical protein